MAKKHIIIKNHNGKDWDILYPETEVTQVITQNGQTLDIEISKKVDKVSGKQLSTNDFTNALKTKLENLNETVQVSATEPTKKTGLWFEVKNV